MLNNDWTNVRALLILIGNLQKWVVIGSIQYKVGTAGPIIWPVQYFCAK